MTVTFEPEPECQTAQVSFTAQTDTVTPDQLLYLDHRTGQQQQIWLSVGFYFSSFTSTS